MKHQEFEEVPLYMEWYDEGTVFHLTVYLKRDGQEDFVTFKNVKDVMFNSNWLKVSYEYLLSMEAEAYLPLNTVRYFSLLIIPPKESADA